MKRGRTGICALVAIDKPAGRSSHDMVYEVRRATGEGRVGHCGTLDPFATGVLVVGIGPATRLATMISCDVKTYEARIVFGCSTITDDLSGDIEDKVDLEAMDEVRHRLLDEAFARELLASFLGVQMQLPPRFSAKKVGGRKAYDLARSGDEVKLEPCEIEVFDAELLGCGSGDQGISGAGSGSGAEAAGGLDVGYSNPAMADLPWWDVRFTVSKGTYIRSLARDIGERVGCGAFLSRLRRTCSGNVGISDAIEASEIPRLAEPGFLASRCLDPAAVVGAFVHECSHDELVRVSNGAPVTIWNGEGDHDGLADAPAAMVRDGRMHAVYVAGGARRGGNGESGVRYTSRMVIPGGVIGVG